jgi:hypothetical protein
MIAYDAPGIYAQAFFSLAEPYAIHYNVFILLSGKYIDPFYNRKADEMSCTLDL